MRRWAMIAAAACTALAGCSDADSSATAPQVSVSDSAGIRTIELGALDQIEAPLRAVRLAYSTAGSVELFRVSDAAFMPGGRLAIANSGSSEVLVLDSVGAVVERLGGEGDGPGEFGRLYDVGVTAEGDLWAYDRGLGRLTRFSDSDGKARTRALVPPDRITALQALVVDWDGTVLAIIAEHRMFLQSGESRDTVPLLIYRAGSEEADTLGSWLGLEKGFVSSPRASMQLTIGFRRSLERAGSPAGAILGSTDSLALAVYDPDGNLMMRIVGGGTPIPVSDAEVRAWRDEKLASAPDVPGFTETWVKAYEEVRVNRTYPAFGGVAIDDVGRVWVAEYPRGDSLQSWWVFGRDGPEARVELPTESRVLAVSGSSVAVLRRDEVGQQIIDVFRLYGE